MALTKLETVRLRMLTLGESLIAPSPPLPAELVSLVNQRLLVLGQNSEFVACDHEPILTEFHIAAAVAAYGPSETSFPQDEILNELSRLADGVVQHGEVRMVECLLVEGALLGWVKARVVLLDLIRRMIQPALRWLYHKEIPEIEGHWEDEWVKQEATDCSGLILEWLLQGCECYRHSRELSVEIDSALVRCRTIHQLGTFDGHEPLARFICRAAVCVHDYYRPSMDDFSNLAEWRPKRLAINEFHYGMLAKAVGLGSLRAGYVLRCEATPGCSGEINPTSDCCENCNELTKSGVPKTLWMWANGRYGPSDCRLCRTDGYYYFLYHRPCPRNEGTPEHQWQKGPSRKVWVRVTFGGDILAAASKLEETSPSWELTPAARQIIGEGLSKLPQSPVRALGAELLSVHSNPPQAAMRRGLDILDVSFQQQWLDVLQAFPQLLPQNCTDLFCDAELASLARLLFSNARLTLRQAAKRVGMRANSKKYRNAVLVVLSRTLGFVLEHARPSDAERDDEVFGGASPKLLEFIAQMCIWGQVRDLAHELLENPVRAELVAERRGMALDAVEFVELLLATVQAVRPGLPFCPVSRFGDQEMRRAAELIFGREALNLGELELKLHRDFGITRPRETVQGVLLNVTYAANGLLEVQNSTEGAET